MDSRQQRKQDHDRRRQRRVLVAVAVVGVLLLLAFDAWLRHVTQDADVERALHRIAVASLVLRLAAAAATALLARFLFDWARQTREQGQWPPAGLDWPGPPLLRHGEDARRIAARLRVAGLASIGVALLLAAVTAWRLFA